MFIKQVALSFIGIFLLALWDLSFKISCISLVFPFLVGIMILRSRYKFTTAQRRCFSGCYFKEDSFIYKFFTKKYIALIFSIFSGIILSVFLVFNVILFNFYDYSILIGDIFLLVFLFNYFNKIKSLKPNVKKSIVKNIAVTINSIFLVVLFLFVGFYQTPPVYIQNDLINTIHSTATHTYSNCYFLNIIGKAVYEIVAIKWWAILDLTVNITNSLLKQLIWIGFLLGNFMMAHAFGNYILELLNIFNLLNTKGVENEKK